MFALLSRYLFLFWRFYGYVSVDMWAHVLRVGGSWRSEESRRGHELPTVGAGRWAQVLCKRSKFSDALTFQHRVPSCCSPLLSRRHGDVSLALCWVGTVWFPFWWCKIYSSMWLPFWFCRVHSSDYLRRDYTLDTSDYHVVVVRDGHEPFWARHVFWICGSHRLAFGMLSPQLVALFGSLYPLLVWACGLSFLPHAMWTATVSCFSTRWNHLPCFPAVRVWDGEINPSSLRLSVIVTAVLK